ncbi:MAG: hypothetical protein LBJ83_01460 [Oscillospiraceae bacterium]|nr:hypothetical protein [Oscillospiraceae bacterium]
MLDTNVNLIAAHNYLFGVAEKQERIAAFNLAGMNAPGFSPLECVKKKEKDVFQVDVGELPAGEHVDEVDQTMARVYAEQEMAKWSAAVALFFDATESVLG